MMQVLNRIFMYEGEEWAADESALLTSNPPKYSCYRLSDNKHMYIDTMELGKYTVVRFIHPGELMELLNPGSSHGMITVSSPPGNYTIDGMVNPLGASGGIVTFAPSTKKTITEIYDLDPLPQPSNEPSEVEVLKERVKQLEESMKSQSMIVPAGPDKNLKDDEWHVIFSDYRNLETGIVTKIKPGYASGMNALFKVRKIQ